MNEDIKSYIDQRDTIVEQKIKLWIMSSVLAQIALLLPIIFLLGGIYQNLNASASVLAAQQADNSRQTAWMQEREATERELQQWAITKGFKPSQEPSHVQ